MVIWSKMINTIIHLRLIEIWVSKALMKMNLTKIYRTAV